MTFDIVIVGSPERTILRWLEDIVGTDNVEQGDGRMRISVVDQAAMVGLLNRINDLGLEIELVERR